MILLAIKLWKNLLIEPGNTWNSSLICQHRASLFTGYPSCPKYSLIAAVFAFLISDQLFYLSIKRIQRQDTDRHQLTSSDQRQRPKAPAWRGVCRRWWSQKVISLFSRRWWWSRRCNRRRLLPRQDKRSIHLSIRSISINISSEFISRKGMRL